MVVGSPTGQHQAFTLAVHPLNGDIFFGGRANDAFTTEGYSNVNQPGGLLVRAHPSGKAVWTKSISWTSTVAGVMDIALYAPSSLPLSKHFVAVCGYTVDKLPARYTTTDNSSAAILTPFLQRYALNGTLEWETGFPVTGGYGNCLSAHTLSGGNIVVLLQVWDRVGGPFTFQGVTSVSGDDHSLAMMMLDSTGGLVWFNSFGAGVNQDQTGGLTAHDTGDLATSSIYAMGTISGAFGGNTAYGGSDFIMWRVAADSGAAVWQKQAGGDQADLAMGIAVSPDNMRVYVVGGVYSSSIEYPPGHTITRNGSRCDPILLTMQASDGTPLSGRWPFPTGTTAGFAMAVTVNSTNGDVFVAGYDSAATFGGQPSRGSADIFTIRLDSNLDMQWLQMTGGTGWEVGSSIAFSPVHQGVIVLGQGGSPSGMFPSLQSTTTILGLGTADALVVGFNATDGAMLEGTNFPDLSIETTWSAMTPDVTDGPAQSSDAQPTLTVPYALRDTDVVVQFTLDGATLWVNDGQVADGHLTLHAPSETTGLSAAFFSVQSEDATFLRHYTLRIVTATNTDAGWTAAVSGGSAFGFTSALSSDSSVNERFVLLPPSARGLPFELALTFARNSTVDPVVAALPISLTTPASPSDPAVEYSFNVTAQDGVTRSGRIVLQFSVAPFTDCNVSIVASVPSLNFTSPTLSSNNSAVSSFSSVTELFLPLPSAAADRNVTLTFTLPPFAALTDGAPLVAQLTAAAVGEAVSLNFSVVAESGAVQSYTLRLPVGVDEQQLNDGGGESSGLTNAQRNAAIAVPVIVGGVALIALAAFALHRWSRPKTSSALPPPSSSIGPGVVSSAGVASAHAGDGSANEMAVLPAAPQAGGGANASGVVVVHVE